MDLLKAEIERKRKATEELKRQTAAATSIQENENHQNTESIDKKPRYIRQKDIIEREKREFEESARRLEEHENEKRKVMEMQAHHLSNNEKRKNKSSDTKQIISTGLTITSKQSHNMNGNNNNDSNDNHENLKDHEFLRNLSIKEIYSKLRDLKQPVTLFGESVEERLKRLEKAIIAKRIDDYAKDMRNSEKNEEYENRDRRSSFENDEEDEEDNEEEEKDEDKQGSHKKTGTSDNNNDNNIIDNHDDSDDESIENEKKSGKDKNKSHGQNHVYGDGPILYSQISNYPKEKVIYKYFKSILKVWETDLNEREDRIKLSAKGKMDTKTQKQCKDYIRPLFKMCKKKQIEHNMMLHLFEIVRLCEEGNFRLAHEEYLRTAIGNAAWPIGLTMVGIHERSGREKISTSKIAHVMNNEMERKYLTSVRRLMTYAQTKRPDIPPSMKVL